MIGFLTRLRNDEAGYGMAFAAFTLFTLVCFVAYTVNVSEFTSRRIKSQGAIDSGVYSGAKQQADMLTAIAVINIVMRVLYGIYMIGFVLFLIPWTTGIGRAIMQICQIALIALSFVERGVATIFTYTIMAKIGSQVTENLKMGTSGSQGEGLAFAPEPVPAAATLPMGALYALVDDYLAGEQPEVFGPHIIGHYMKAEDNDERLPIITVGAIYAQEVSNIKIDKLSDKVRITPLIFYEGTDDGDEGDKDIKHCFFDKGIMGMAKWTGGSSGGRPPLLGGPGGFFENPDLSAFRYGSGKVLAIGAGRAWNANFKRSNLDSLDNHYRTGWKPKLISMREAGLFGCGNEDDGQDFITGAVAAALMGELGVILLAADVAHVKLGSPALVEH